MIAIVLVGVIGVTTAYFNDTEESLGNFFEAGAVDLTVDSEGHYNGLECVDNKWQECDYTGEGVNLLTNGGFEFPVVGTPELWQIYPSGTVGLGWIVEWMNPAEPDYSGLEQPEVANLELHRGVNGWTAYEPEQYAELDSDWDGPSGSVSGEPALTKIYQDIVTTPGAKYKLSYWFSPRPSTGAGDNELKVYVDGVEVGSHSGAGGAQTSWIQYSTEFFADGDTRIEFVGGGTSNSLGVFLDDVSLKEMLRTCEPSEEYTEQCFSSWSLTDLGQENKFFAFGDLKPGDWGENTISLHVENNDVHACMYFTDYSDLDITLVEPEIADPDEPQKDNPGPGELGENIYFFAWWDDGDNVYEDGEEKITLSPELAETFLDNDQHYLGQIAKSQTKYVGLAWCFGGMTVNEDYSISCSGVGSQNETQTDRIESTVGFYIEQVRHNQDFVCPALVEN